MIGLGNIGSSVSLVAPTNKRPSFTLTIIRNYPAASCAAVSSSLLTAFELLQEESIIVWLLLMKEGSIIKCTCISGQKGVLTKSRQWTSNYLRIIYLYTLGSVVI